MSKIRLTGGEPLVRREVERLVEMLARIHGLGDLALTTNGSALARKARALGDAGLRRITVSLDSLDDEVFAAVNDVGFPVDACWRGSRPRRGGPCADQDQLVVKRGVNEDTSSDGPPFSRQRRHRALHRVHGRRHTNGWRIDDVVPAAEIVEIIGAEFPLEPVAPNYRGEVVER